MRKNNKVNKSLDSFNLELTNNQIRIILLTVVILVIILLFRKQFHTNIERIIVFTIIFLLFLIISKNLVLTFIGTSIIFLFVNLIIRYRNVMENFDNDTSSEKTIPKPSFDINSEPSIDMGIFQTDEFKKSSEGIQELLKRVNGGIELKDDDLKETNPIGIDLSKYKDDEKPNSLKIAQKESYELINTVNALKDTISTLSPVLQEGKKLMSLFETLKF
jgi:hypothetical protein